MRSFIAGLFAVWMILGSAIAVAQQPAGQVSNPVAEAPTFSIGDSWTVGKRTQEVREIKGGNVVVYEKTTGTTSLCGSIGIPVTEMFAERDKNWTIMKITNAVGEHIPDCRHLTEKPLKYLDFPLAVGKKWSFTAGKEVNHGKGPHVDMYANEMTVESYEDVTIDAGTFKAFKIRQNQRQLSCEQSLSNKMMSVATAYSWYAPDVKHIIKGTDSLNNTWELKSFELK